MNDNTYNGWKNYETWNVKLWMDNDQGSQEYWQETAREILERNDCDKDAAAADLAEAIEQWHEEMQEQMVTSSGVFADLLNAAMREVDWREIAENILSGITVYAAGWNMPGYLPDSEPARFLDAQDALEYIKAECETENEWADCSGWKADNKGEFGCTVGKYHYFVQEV